ncbi:hypothetical protein LTR66_004110 [Elasticomyces elasticus]|nr:hypothetical protein LTR66_004110 [Elasticomyces elasticus]
MATGPPSAQSGKPQISKSDLASLTHRNETLLRRSGAICPSCSLPRLLNPPLQPTPPGPYCSRTPWCTKVLHDIHGNPFPVFDSKPPTKRERENLLKASKNQSQNGENTSQDGTAPSSPSIETGGLANGPVDKKAAKVGERLKGGTYIPWHTCPSCKRSLLITRFAQHLEKCLGIAGRAAGRTAMQRLNGNTPVGSRGGTPLPGAGTKGDAGDADEDDGPGASFDAGTEKEVRKKVLKRGLKKNNASNGDKPPKPKPKDKEAQAQAGAMAAKRLPKSTPAASTTPTSADKRERQADELADEDEALVRKKVKMKRMSSMASVHSAAASEMGMAREESMGSSFVDEGSGDD